MTVRSQSRRFGVAVYDDAIPHAWTTRLRRQLRHPSPTLTWSSLNVAPRNFFEQVIHYMHRITKLGTDCEGAEYWGRIQPANTGFNFHFDRDEAVKHRVVSPLLSSILYLSDVGGPTLILDGSPTTKHAPKRGLGVFPRPGRFAIFPGEFSHGVQPGESSRWPRIAFFINWWAHRPKACLEPSEELGIISPLLGRVPAAPKLKPSRKGYERFVAKDLIDAAGWKMVLQQAVGVPAYPKQR